MAVASVGRQQNLRALKLEGLLLYGVLAMLLAYRLLMRDWIRRRPNRADKEKRK
jgi:hypothetical protein